MAGELKTALLNAAKAVVADLGKGLDSKITYTRRLSTSYDVATGEFTQFDRPYEDIYVPVEYINSEEEEGREEREAKLYISPDLIGNNQPTLQDEITFKYADGDRVAQITDVKTYKGILFVVMVRF
jgi:hypothetical protein